MLLPGERTLDTNRSLLDRAAGGSGEALSTLFERHSADVHLVAYRLTLSADDAEDIVQNVFVGLPEALATYGGSGDFGAWLRKVTVRVALMHLRSTRRREATAKSAQAAKANAISNFLLDRMAIATALTALPEPLRIVFMLSDVQGYTHAEIGTLLGIRAGTSEVRLHRARRKLRALLGDR